MHIIFLQTHSIRKFWSTVSIMHFSIRNNELQLAIPNRLLLTIQSNAVITRSNIVTHCINNCRNWGRISIRRRIHKIHPVPRPNGELWVVFCECFWENWPRYIGTALYLKYIQIITQPAFEITLNKISESISKGLINWVYKHDIAQ